MKEDRLPITLPAVRLAIAEMIYRIQTTRSVSAFKTSGWTSTYN